MLCVAKFTILLTENGNPLIGSHPAFILYLYRKFGSDYFLVGLRSS